MQSRFVLVLVGLCAFSLATPAPGIGQRKYKVADREFLQKQRDILGLFKYINQPLVEQEHLDIVKNTPKLKDWKDAFTRVEVVDEYLQLIERGLLPKGEIFSVFNQDQLYEAIALFRLFYYAKDYDTFYKSAVLGRYYANEGVFIYALSVAIVHRQDTYGIVLPPIYEIYPYYFFPTEVIQKAQEYKQIYSGEEVQPDSDGYKGYTVNANYSGWYLNVNPEQSLSYFTEDVSVNSFYYYFNIYYPFWMDGEEFGLKNDRRGEQFYYVYQQIIARYYLERLSNDFGEIPYYDYDRPVKTGYYPSLRYPNGLAFPARPSGVELYRPIDDDQNHAIYFTNYTFSYTIVKDIERRIRDAIDSGYVFTEKGEKYNIYSEEGLNVLGNLIEGNPDSLNEFFYGPWQIYARFLLGYSYYPLDKYKLAPSALEHFETSLRDPIFYQLFKKVVLFFQKYKAQLKPYTRQELLFEGVKVTDVQIDRLITYFDYFYSDISNGVYVNKKEYKEDTFQVRARQERLNHKPFTYTVNVESEKDTDAVVRVFLGPKYDEYGREYTINNNRMNFVLMDRFVYKLKTGKNVIERNSRQNFYASDRTTYKVLYQRVLSALNGGSEFQLDGSEAYFGWPNRFALPIGKRNGMTYQLYVMVMPYNPYQGQEGSEEYYYPRVGTGGQYIDTLPLGYPFDRPIRYENQFYVPNSYFKDVVVYHKTRDEISQ